MAQLVRPPVRHRGQTEPGAARSAGQERSQHASHADMPAVRQRGHTPAAVACGKHHRGCAGVPPAAATAGVAVADPTGRPQPQRPPLVAPPVRVCCSAEWVLAAAAHDLPDRFQLVTCMCIEGNPLCCPLIFAGLHRQRGPQAPPVPREPEEQRWPKRHAPELLAHPSGRRRAPSAPAAPPASQGCATCPSNRPAPGEGGEQCVRGGRESGSHQRERQGAAGVTAASTHFAAVRQPCLVAI